MVKSGLTGRGWSINPWKWCLRIESDRWQYTHHIQEQRSPPQDDNNRIILVYIGGPNQIRLSSKVFIIYSWAALHRARKPGYILSFWNPTGWPIGLNLVILYDSKSSVKCSIKTRVMTKLKKITFIRITFQWMFNELLYIHLYLFLNLIYP